MPNAPTVTTGSKTSYDDTGNIKVDIADAIDALDPRDTPCLSLLGKSSLRKGCTERAHYWLEDELIPSAAEVDAAYTANALVFNLRPVGGASGDDATDYCLVDDVLLCGDTHYQATTVDLTANLVYVRLLSSSDEAHSVGDKVYNLGQAATEGSVARVVSEFTSLVKPYNYTQIFKGEVAVTGTQEVIEKYGYASELSYQESKKLEELAIKLERAFIYGRRNVPTTNTQPAGMMGGLYWWIRTNMAGTADGNIIKDNGAVALTENTLLGVIENIWSLGGSPDLIICNGYQARTIDGWMTPFVQGKMDDSTLGTVVSRYRSRFGDMQVLLNRYLKQSDLIICTKKYLGIGPLDGRAFATIPIAKRGDSVERLILGEYTAEVRCVGRAHGWIYNLATS